MDHYGDIIGVIIKDSSKPKTPRDLLMASGGFIQAFDVKPESRDSVHKSNELTTLRANGTILSANSTAQEFFASQHSFMHKKLRETLPSEDKSWKVDLKLAMDVVDDYPISDREAVGVDTAESRGNSGSAPTVSEVIQMEPMSNKNQLELIAALDDKSNMVMS